MPATKLLGLAVIAVAIPLVFSQKNDGGIGSAWDAVISFDFSAIFSLQDNHGCAIQGGLLGTCSERTFFHYNKCCGVLNNECCFALQIWIYVLIGLLVLTIIIAFVIEIFCCFCLPRRR